MRFDRRFLSAILAFCMMLGLMQGALAAEIPAEYGPANYADIAASTYARMLLYKRGNGVVAAADESGLYGLVDLAGRVITDFQYQGMWVLDGGLFKISDSDDPESVDAQQGVIDYTGEILLPMGNYRINCCNKIVRVFTLPYDGYIDSGYDGNGVAAYYTLDWEAADKSDYWDAVDSIYDETSAPPLPEWADEYDYCYRKGDIYIVYKDGKTGAVDENNLIQVPLDDYSGTICGRSQTGYISVVSHVYVENKPIHSSTDEFKYVSDVYKDGSLVKTFDGMDIGTAAYYRDLSFSTDGRYHGMMTIDEEILIEAKYAAIEDDYNGHLLTVSSDEEDGYRYVYGLYSYDGEEIFADRYSLISYVAEDKYILCDAASGYYGAMGVAGLNPYDVIPLEYEDYTLYSYYFADFIKDGQHNTFNLDGDTILPTTESIRIFSSELFGEDGPIEGEVGRPWLPFIEKLSQVWDRYDGGFMPLVIKTSGTESGYATYYVDYKTGENKGYIPYRASNINDDGYFIYQDISGKYGIGGTNGLPEGSAALPGGVKYVPFSWIPLGESSSYSVVSGTLPSGMAVNSETGEIYGVPMAAGIWEFVVRTDTADVPYVLTIEDNTNTAVQRPNDYEITTPVGVPSGYDPNAFILDSYRDETLVIEGPYSEFMVMRIDGRELKRDVEYSVREGSTVITIYAQTFQKYGEGTHTISAEFREGGKADGKLKTVSQNYTVKLRQPSPNPGGSSSGGSSGGGSSNSKPTKPSKPAEPTTPKPTVPTPPVVPAMPFADVTADRWFYDDVKWAYDGKIMTGTTATTFAPNTDISQATIVTVLARIAGVDLEKFSNTVDSSIESGKYYTEAAMWAKQSGLLPDYSVFTGEETISRDQMAIMLVKYLRSMGKDTTPPAQPVAFADAEQMSADGNAAFQVLYQRNIFRGMGDGRMDPAGFTTRAQFAALVHRVSNAANG